MIRFSFSITNPWSKDEPDPLSWFACYSLTANKSLEVQFSKMSNYEWFRIDLDLNFRGKDHAGPEFLLNIFGWEFVIKIYDHRHWDYTLGSWEK